MSDPQNMHQFAEALGLTNQPDPEPSEAEQVVAETHLAENVNDRVQRMVEAHQERQAKQQAEQGRRIAAEGYAEANQVTVVRLGLTAKRVFHSALLDAAHGQDNTDE